MSDNSDPRNDGFHDDDQLPPPPDMIDAGDDVVSDAPDEAPIDELLKPRDDDQLPPPPDVIDAGVVSDAPGEAPIDDWLKPLPFIINVDDPDDPEDPDDDDWLVETTDDSEDEEVVIITEPDSGELPPPSVSIPGDGSDSSDAPLKEPSPIPVPPHKPIPAPGTSNGPTPSSGSVPQPTTKPQPQPVPPTQSGPVTPSAGDLPTGAEFHVEVFLQNTSRKLTTQEFVDLYNKGVIRGGTPVYLRGVMYYARAFRKQLRQKPLPQYFVAPEDSGSSLVLECVIGVVLVLCFSVTIAVVLTRGSDDKSKNAPEVPETAQTQPENDADGASDVPTISDDDSSKSDEPVAEDETATEEPTPEAPTSEEEPEEPEEPEPAATESAAAATSEDSTADATTTDEATVDDPDDVDFDENLPEDESTAPENAEEASALEDDSTIAEEPKDAEVSKETPKSEEAPATKDDVSDPDVPTKSPEPSAEDDKSAPKPAASDDAQPSIGDKRPDNRADSRNDAGTRAGQSANENTKAASNPESKPEKKASINGDGWLAKGFDVNQTKLPKNFRGHNFLAVRDALLRPKYQVPERRSGESEDFYQSRVDTAESRAKSSPLFGDVRTNSRLAFVLPNAAMLRTDPKYANSGTEYVTATYNSTSKTMTVSKSLGVFGVNFFDTLHIAPFLLSAGSYGLAIESPLETGFKWANSDSYAWLVRGIPNKDFEKIKDSVCVLCVVVVDYEGLGDTGLIGASGNYALYTREAEFWVYDSKSGEVLGKFSFDDTLSEEPHDYQFGNVSRGSAARRIGKRSLERTPNKTSRND